MALSLFPKDYRFSQDKLICLWKSLGFLDNDNVRDKDRAGRFYLSYLLTRSIIIQCVTNMYTPWPCTILLMILQCALQVKSFLDMRTIYQIKYQRLFGIFLCSVGLNWATRERLNEALENKSFARLPHQTQLSSYHQDNTS